MLEPKSGLLVLCRVFLKSYSSFRAPNEGFIESYLELLAPYNGFLEPYLGLLVSYEEILELIPELLAPMSDSRCQIRSVSYYMMGY